VLQRELSVNKSLMCSTSFLLFRRGSGVIEAILLYVVLVYSYFEVQQ